MQVDSTFSAATQVAEPRSYGPLTLAERYRAVRGFTEKLAKPLETEDYVVQTMEDVSPTKWHLAHVSWFFDTFVLKEHLPNYEPFHPDYAYLFNSYYVQAGERHCRDRRGYISRPTVSEVYAYRAHVDEQPSKPSEARQLVLCTGKVFYDLIEERERRGITDVHILRMEQLYPIPEDALRADIDPLVEIGLHHEQQHQELLLTDIKHVLSVNPLRPAYDETLPQPRRERPPLNWIHFEEGLREVGHTGDDFAYDNERPRHRVFLEEFLLATRTVTCGEYLAFMDDGGYQRPELWLSAGWATVQENEWTEPFYWEERGGRWHLFTLAGMREIDENEPVCHLSYFEADAYARWADARLPTEQEWEVAAASAPVQGNFVESGNLHPVAAGAPDGSPAGLYGDVWEWTRSQYSPYPGYAPPPGALGEYNGKFMCNQFVLRGGSCATSTSHIRPTYRNFFPPDACWQFTGLRLARDV